MGLEIERRFRLRRLPEAAVLGPGVAVSQGYLPSCGDARVRRLGERYFWTLKGEGDLAREEFDVEIPAWAFERLWPHTEGRRLEKVRHRVEWQGRTLEVDVYLGPLAGLITLECEFPDRDAALAFSLPDWAADAQEITQDSRYRNQALASHGLPEPAG